MSGHDLDGLEQFFEVRPRHPGKSQLSEYYKAITKRVPVDDKQDVLEPCPGALGGKKFDSGKLDYTLLPFKALEDVVKVLGFGAVKYGRDNWQKVERRRYIAAAFRHLIEIAKNNELDEESGETHAAHLTCCSLFLGELNHA